jgi:radical SAM superfamily enzyme YgiQ (UPF0313 family)
VTSGSYVGGVKALLVHARFPTTYWGFQYGLPLAGKRAALPPLGLITLAALLPDDWQLRLIDLNVEELSDEAIEQADVVLVGGMHVQVDSMVEVLARARRLDRPTVVGGPAPTTAPEGYGAADVLFQGEAEGRTAELVAAIEAVVDGGPGGGQVVLMAPRTRPDLASSPVPRFDLLDLSAYGAMAIQCSRGCPFSCEFCDIVEIFGQVPRFKPPARVLAELDALRQAGWGAGVFVVDDNFIGNKRLARQLLAELGRWQAERGHPFVLSTEASVNLAADEELMEAMVAAGFTALFLGIETPSLDALAGAGKSQNLRLDLAEAVRALSRRGLEVMGGFIVGFDSDRAEVFEAQRRFIEHSPIPLAMVGVLTALPGTALWRRLEREGRLRDSQVSDQFGRPNFEPGMDEGELLRGYSSLLGSLYSADAWYDRCEAYIELAPPLPGRRKVSLEDVVTLARTVWRVGVLSRRRGRFWRLMARVVRRAPHTLAWAVTRVIVGEHMIRYTEQDVLPRLEASIGQLAQRDRAA